MNVINKIKSKRNKEQASQIPKQEQGQQIQQQKGLQMQESKQNKSIKTLSQTQPQIKQEQKSHSFREDKDEVSINEYYTMKDKKRQLMNRIQSSDTFREQNLKSSPFCFNIKKSSTIGDICVFQGEVIHQKHGKEVYRKKIKLSCSFETIPFPQNVSKILLQKITMLTNQQGIFVAQSLDKIIEKGNFKK